MKFDHQSIIPGKECVYLKSNEPLPGQKVIIDSLVYSKKEPDEENIYATRQVVNIILPDGSKQTVLAKDIRGEWQKYQQDRRLEQDQKDLNILTRKWRGGVSQSPVVCSPKDFEYYQGDQKASLRFAHGIEADFARLLDDFEIPWNYEPHEFSFLNQSGFKPDFYLPDKDLYIELTMTESTKASYKRKRIRLLAAEYPKTKAIVLYGQDLYTLFNQVLDRARFESYLGQYLGEENNLPPILSPVDDMPLQQSIGSSGPSPVLEQ